jgi:hypothetical protein
MRRSSTVLAVLFAFVVFGAAVQVVRLSSCPDRVSSSPVLGCLMACWCTAFLRALDLRIAVYRMMMLGKHVRASRRSCRI